MVIRTFFDKTNTIIVNDYTNTARNPVAELFYGGASGENLYTRFLFDFDETRLVQLYTGGTFTDITKLTHTLKLTNTSTFQLRNFDNGMYGPLERASSFDLIIFTINQDWDEGVGYDYRNASNLLMGQAAASTQPSNWIYAQTGIYWNNGPGVYSGSPSGITIATQHFDAGNENMEVDITPFVNGLLTGDTNYGLGIAFARPYEETSFNGLQYVGFFTRHTQTFYEPYLETIYNSHIQDDRANFYLDKLNTLYLYVNLAGNPTNLDVLPIVTVYDQNDNIYSAYTSTAITHVTLGVYSVDVLIPTTSDFTEGFILNDVWSNIQINGVSRPDITLSFELKDSWGYYNIGSSDYLPKKLAVSVAGIQNGEKIKRGDIRKVIVSTRIPYTVEQTQTLSNLQYRLYVLEGTSEVTVVDYQPIEITANYNYFLVDTQSLIPNDYYIDIMATSNLEVTTLKNVLEFEIVSDSTYRLSQ